MDGWMKEDTQQGRRAYGACILLMQIHGMDVMDGWERNRCVLYGNVIFEETMFCCGVFRIFAGMKNSFPK